MSDFKIPPRLPEELGLHLDEFAEWYESTSHIMVEGEPFASGARAGWVAAMRFLRGKVASIDGSQVLMDALRESAKRRGGR